MNGIHDMGGMQGFGVIPYQPHEPVFRARWEGRAAALDRALLAWGAWNFDAFRHQVEQIPPPDYLRMSYWERRLTACIELAVKTGMISREEIASGQPKCGAPQRSPALTAEDAASRLTRSTSMIRSELTSPRYCPGDAVRARNINPPYHTRLPRYTRGRTGVVQVNRGAHVFPDSYARGLGEDARHLYTVRFTARELWGDTANPHDAVHVDLWEDYLEPV